jgi:hypothetical protein
MGGNRKRSRALMAAALAVGAFVISLAPLADGDLWWHLAAGREMVRTHAVLRTDPFSSGAAGRAWVDVHWAFQLAVYATYQLGGLRTLVVVKALVVAAGALVLGDVVWRSGGARAHALSVPALLFALFAARGLLLLRPVIPTLLFLALYVRALERFRKEGRIALLVPLPLLQVAWSNVQALSMLGPVVVLAYALAVGADGLSRARGWWPFARELAGGLPARRAASVLAGLLSSCVAACFVTPYGASAVSLPFSLLARLVPGAGNVYSTNIAENVPPWVLDESSPGRFAHLAIYLAALALCLATARRLRPSQLMLAVAFSGLALASNRNVLLLYWVATPIAVVAAAPTCAGLAWRFRRSAARRAGVTALAGAMVAVLALGGVAVARETTIAEPSPWRAPTESARRIAERAGEGDVFAADEYGGYLEWRLGCRHRPFIDTRLVLRSRAEFEEYLAVVDEPGRFDEWESGHAFQYVLLPVGYPDRYLALAARLYTSDRWALIYTDGSEVLFARRSDLVNGEQAWDLASVDVADRILAALAARLEKAPALHAAARTQLATLELAVGQPALAERVLVGVDTPAAEALRARSRLLAGDVAGAEAFAVDALSRDPNDVRGLDVLALATAHKGDLPRAIAFLRRALDADPYDREAQALLAKLEGQ